MLAAASSSLARGRAAGRVQRPGRVRRPLAVVRPARPVPGGGLLPRGRLVHPRPRSEPDRVVWAAPTCGRCASGTWTGSLGSRPRCAAGSWPARDGHQQLSETVRSYVGAVSALPAPTMTLADFRAAGTAAADRGDRADVSAGVRARRDRSRRASGSTHAVAKARQLVMSWTELATSGTELKWPWLVLLLVLLVVVLLAAWRRSLVAAATVRRVVRRPRGATARTAPLPHAGAAPQAARGLRLGRRAGGLRRRRSCSAAGCRRPRWSNRDEAARDIMLCLDASGSTAPWNVDVIQEFRNIVEGLQGERIGLTVWNNAAISEVPADRRLRVRPRPARRGRGGVRGLERDLSEPGVRRLHGRDLESRTAVTSPPWSADGLVSCVQRFDRLDEDRGRALVLRDRRRAARARASTTSTRQRAYAAEDRRRRPRDRQPR